MSKIPSREEALFADALAQSPALREAFLARACGADTALMGRVAALLAAHEAPASLLGTADCAAQRINAIPEEKPGDLIGRYKLLLKIGEGGCGVVFLAEQKDPVRRRVALKVIKAGMDTREVIARFEAERQALALMDHPGICKVLDAGATMTGRPYFVMEFVRGAPITKYCDDNQLTTQARLELFMQVCHAVQHAHQKGIIHRDLKPSNILVTLNETGATPKVIDFGIAKATQGRLTDATLVTAFEQFLGTPAYMSPEQAEMRGLDIDTRSDVYSLGVLLYELLSGRPPFDPKMLMTASRDELRRIIREVDPPKPSTHLATLDASDRTTVAQRRGTEPAKLRQLLSGDLDWIVMRALEKNRVRRYETPAALADDIGRHFRHELVVARPPGTLYRMGKFTRRHQRVVAAATAVGLVLIAGTIVSTLLAIRATKAEKVAENERERAVEARKGADKLLAFMLNLSSEVQKLGQLDLLSQVGDQATHYFASLDPRDLSDEVLLQQVKSLRQIAEVQINKARYDDAGATLEAAKVRAFTLVARHPKNGEMLYERAQVEYWIGHVHRRKGDDAAARIWITRYRDSGAELAKLDPEKFLWQREFVSAHHNLAVLDLDSGNLEEARRGFGANLAMYEKMAANNPDDPSLQQSLARTDSFLGTVAERRGDFTEALERYRSQEARLVALLARDPQDRERRFSSAVSMSLQVDVLAIMGRRSDARELLTRALAIFDALVAYAPAHQRWLNNCLMAHVKGVMLDRAEGNLPSAVTRLDEIRPKIETLAAAAPSDRNLVGLLVTAWRLEADLLRATDRPDASEAASRAVKHAARLVSTDLTDSRILGECAQAHVTAGTVAHAAGQRDAALQNWQSAFDLLKSQPTESSDWRLLDPAARALAYLGRVDESRVMVTRLHGLGYRPLQPWPETVAAQLSVSSTKNQ